MTKARRKPFDRLRAAVLMLVFALGWLSAPVALATESTNTCSMVCCVEDGHCCCNPARPYVKGQLPGTSDKVDRLAVVSRCPDGCAAPQYSSSSLRGLIYSDAHNIVLLAPALRWSEQRLARYGSEASGPSSPRGPPRFFFSLTA